jgi:MoaA/NifB/PqqE/SkfB family radical SAM enzyme
MIKGIVAMALNVDIPCEDINIPEINKKLWIYTNYDCNLQCRYCLAESSPKTPRRAIGLGLVKQIVDEARTLGIEHFYFTGGEPFILDDIYAMVAYAAEQSVATVLTNAMLLRGKRMEKLLAIRTANLIIQVSLDGSSPEQHDPYRGVESWQKTVEGIHNLRKNGFRVHLSTTETPANTAHLDEICAFHQALGIPEIDHFVRPLAKRGFSDDGIEVSKENLAPEMTVNVAGVFWHPISTKPDLQVNDRVLPLSDALIRMQAELSRLCQPAAIIGQEPAGLKTLQ